MKATALGGVLLLAVSACAPAAGGNPDSGASDSGLADGGTADARGG